MLPFEPLRLAAIEALGTICPRDSVAILANLTDSQDEDVAETASEAMSIAEGMSDGEFDDNEFEDDLVSDEDDEELGNGNHESIH